MAKALVHYYSFDPSTNTVRIENNVAKERLLIITNVTDNTIIYNFADSTLGASSVSYDEDTEETVIVLEYDCNQMSSTDKLQIFWEMDHVEFEPSETFVDPVSKFRVSNPENLIDTDFEYGPQASKWETLQLINQIPSFFSSTADTTISFIETVSSTQDSELITVTTGFDHNLTSGTPITVTGLTSITAEGTYLIQSVPNNTTFTYKARAKQLTTTELQGTYTSIIPGQFFQGSQISVDTAVGITSDYFTRVVTGGLVQEITVGNNVSFTWDIGEEVTGSSGGSGILVKKSGNVITLSDISGTFTDGDTINIVGSSNSYVIGVGGVAAPDYRFFIDGELQPDLELRKKSIYRFDLSSSTLNGHTFEFSETEDGTNNGGTEYTTFVYKFGTIGQPGAYIRIYVTNSTPTLYYYCGYGAGHEDEGGDASTIIASDTKVLLRTESEHGFADNTNFYFVNSISPKALDVNDPTAIAPDGVPFVDDADQKTFVGNVDSTQTIPYDNESTYTVRFGANDIDYGSDTITIPDHNFQNGYAVLYYPAPGDIPLGGLNRMQVYYVERVDANNIRLHDAQRINRLKNLTTGGTFNYGAHTLGLCYNVYREYKTWGDFYAYFYTYYWYYKNRGYPTASGHDFSSNTAPYNTTFGLGGVAWDFVTYFSNARPGYGGHNQFLYNYEWYQRFGTYWRTYGYHLQTLPLTNNAIYQGGYDFITDNTNWGVAGNNNYGYGYTVGGYNRVNGRGYWTSTFWGEFMNSDYLRLYGNETTYWAYQGNTDGWWASRDGYRDTNDRYFNNIDSDGNTNMYFMLCKRNTSTNDSFYAPNHGFQTNYPLVLSVTSGNGILYWNNSTNGTARYNNGSTFYADRVDENRFRIKTSTGASPVRIAAADGQYVFNSTVTNPTKNSIYISNNQFSNGELILVTKELSGTIIGGLTDNSTYYFRALDGNRFQLLQNPGDSNEINLTSTGSGIHTFENASASFGAVDGSYTTTRAIDEFTLEITLPFKIAPGNKSFNGSSDVDITNNLIVIANHYLSTGTKIIYNANGNSAIGGLTDNTDYYVIVKDDAKIQIAETVEDAIAGTPLDLTATSSGIHRIITANLSGLITGAGTISVTSGSRRIRGTSTTFKRYFKIGDIITLIDTSTSPTGTLYERRITAIKDDTEMLVETAATFTNSNAKYFIPTYIYVRPDGYFLHRPFDGGMEIGTSKSPDGLICRQTRKYFRYQSGKGIQTSFAINFIPQNQIVLLSYTPQGTPGTYSFTGLTGDIFVTVDEGTAALAANMEIESGNGVDNSCTILSIIDANTVELSLPLTADITSEPVVLSEAKYSTIRAQRPHNVEVGTIISITQSSVSQYNGDFAVTEILNDFEFRILVKDLPFNISASGGFPQFGVKRWTNSAVRAGMFDFQNGFFFEYDGEYINCVRRSSVQQLTGTLSVTLNSSVVHGVDTLFTSQLQAGDKVVIRGMTHKVVKIRNNTDMVIQPAYRGVTNDNVVGTKTVDVKVPQPEWNIDRCDGEGPSGFILDINRIQMCYADYSWYGAGKIRFGFKDQHGHVKYVHEFKHNNRLRESYFRSGNLPARYEIENTGTPSFVPSLFHWGTSVIMDGTFQDDEAYLFTASGDVQKFTNASTQTSSSNGNSIILEQRISSFNSIYFIRIPFASSEASKLTVNTLIFQNTAGNGFFLDGRVIDSRSFTSGSTYYVYVQYLNGSQSVFPRNYGSTIQAQLCGAIPSGTTFNVGARAGSENLIPSYMPLLSIRLAPSVDSSITGSLGQREIVNRMQLDLESVGVQVTHDSEIALILNPELSTDAYENVSTPSLCQLVRHQPNETISGGQRILSFRAAGGASNKSATTVYDLTQISSLGNSILGGDGVYPNGPDLLCIVAEVIDSTGVSTSVPYSVSARITWKESQA
jgi:hypothetical protein